MTLFTWCDFMCVQCILVCMNRYHTHSVWLRCAIPMLVHYKLHPGPLHSVNKITINRTQHSISWYTIAVAHRTMWTSLKGCSLLRLRFLNRPNGLYENNSCSHGESFSECNYVFYSKSWTASLTFIKFHAISRCTVYWARHSDLSGLSFITVVYENQSEFSVQGTVRKKISHRQPL